MGACSAEAHKWRAAVTLSPVTRQVALVHQADGELRRLQRLLAEPPGLAYAPLLHLLTAIPDGQSALSDVRGSFLAAMAACLNGLVRGAATGAEKAVAAWNEDGGGHKGARCTYSRAWWPTCDETHERFGVWCMSTWALIHSELHRTAAAHAPKSHFACSGARGDRGGGGERQQGRGAGGSEGAANVRARPANASIHATHAHALSDVRHGLLVPAGRRGDADDNVPHRVRLTPALQALGTRYGHKWHCELVAL